MIRIAIIAFLLCSFISQPASADRIYIIPIKGVIDGGLAKFIERAVDEAQGKDASAIIFDINTPGGRVDSATIIRDAILNASIPTIAFINHNAISAGALISLACKEIVMTPGSSIGAATAVDLSGKKASEKVISYMRAEMRATAEATGRNPRIAEAMVDEEIEIEDVTIEGKLLTLTTEEALKLTISDRTVKNLDDLLDQMDISGRPPIIMKPNWAENIVRFLTHPAVSSLLMTIGFLGLIFEVKTPGWGIGGTIALIALGLFFGSHLIVRLAGFEALLVFAIGVILLIAEIFFIPGFGIAGIMGIIALVLSLFLSLTGKFPTSQDVTNAFLAMGASLLMTIVLTILLFKYGPKTSLYGKIVLSSEEKVAEGFISQTSYKNLVGARGVALTLLRPSGMGLFGDQRLPIVTEGEFIPKDTAIVIIKVEGARIVVRAV